MGGADESQAAEMFDGAFGRAVVDHLRDQGERKIYYILIFNIHIYIGGG